MEDVGRHRADVTANSSLTEVLDLNTHAFVSTKWANVKVGDFIRIRTRENIPADCVVISVAEKDEQIRGRCFVVCFFVSANTLVVIWSVATPARIVMDHMRLL
jgi:magnesium-transporting ATPase (P-type)